ncbi:endothelin-1 [Callorhinchus milii]|uniref:endothelin-1 n=1 Tax=Callorhinchus milii TaxID=7868 RepID=UPI0004574B7C|nr:endothelin-1 [Callorhinchus milii]|eukprot:gi/632976031/ref/XP_007904565.1/ PREDICTED: endothelin-1 [Callorhinchus milii]
MEFNVICLLVVMWGLSFSTGSPVSGAAVAASAAPSGDPTVSLAPRRLSRSKRCSCSSFLDKECIYFCHLDIIWINTPERIVPYGLGSSPRVRRSVKNTLTMSSVSKSRCKCVNQQDSSCWQFCEDGHQARWFQIKDQKRSLEADPGSIHQTTQDCKGHPLKCAYIHLRNITKKLKPRKGNILPTSMKWISKIRKLMQENHINMKHLQVSKANSMTECNDCKR